MALFNHYLLPVSEQIIHFFWNSEIGSQPVTLKKISLRSSARPAEATLLSY